MIKIAILGGLALSVAATTGNAFGRDDRWSAGFGMGVIEATVTQGAGNRIDVACASGALRPNSITFEIGGRTPEGERLFFSFDGGPIEDVWVSNGRIEADCRACVGTFYYVIERLKAHSRVSISTLEGKTANFTLLGSADAIGDCPNEW
ncbi:MAG: hypothetical protein ACU0BF_03990 [Paracoccaceae bacterium]